MKLVILAASALGFGTAVVLAQTDAAIAGVQAPYEVQMVAMGDHHLYMNCVGRGRPTVMMEAGYGDSSDVWRAVQPTLAAFTRVCVYDRAGLGRSEPVGPRTVQDVADDLSALLDATIAGPVVLVGHSVGGLLANMVAHRRPGKVTGLVLVDSSHPDQVARLRRNLPRGWLEALDTYFADAPAFETWDSDTATAQGVGVYAQPASLGDLPLVVLTRDVDLIDADGIRWIKENIWAGYSEEVDRLYGAAWLELQRELLTLSTNSSQRIVAGSTHYIQKDRPEVVVEAVRQVVRQARTREGAYSPKTLVRHAS